MLYEAGVNFAFFEPYGRKSTPWIPKVATRASIKLSLAEAIMLYESEVNSAFLNPTGGNRPRGFPKSQREHRLRFNVQ